MLICVLTHAGAPHAPQSSHVREGGVGTALVGIPPVLAGFLCPSIVGADVALDDARRLGRTGRAGDVCAAGAARALNWHREACAHSK